ncbi:methionyl-tRNA formyltransferase [Salinibacter ruber]|uniref:formyltransferase family protein n=1 Tax=Salinibacter ruber TaxID=146919 RepID=UPI0021680652|nr:formyltransferase family protein [Salinibacter ruber]MCS3855303.1 methionyl-tRNA formyltransferase [Salinibacter ruber]
MNIGFVGERKNIISASIFQALLKCNECSVQFVVESDLPESKRVSLYNEYEYSKFLTLAKKAYAQTNTLLSSSKKSYPDNKKIASEHGVKYIVPENRSINDGLPTKMYNKPSVHYVIIGGCDQILDSKGLEIASEEVVNYHYSILPAYRGKFSLFWQWYNNADKIGFTFHEVNEKIDDGNIVFQKAIRTDGVGDINNLKKTVLKETCKSIPELISHLKNGRKARVNQNVNKSYYPSEKYHNLIEINKEKRIDEIRKVIAKRGHMKLPSGFRVDCIKNSIRNKQMGPDISSNGLIMPVYDGTLILEPSTSIPLPILRVAEGERLFGLEG